MKRAEISFEELLDALVARGVLEVEGEEVCMTFSFARDVGRALADVSRSPRILALPLPRRLWLATVLALVRRYPEGIRKDELVGLLKILRAYFLRWFKAECQQLT